MPCTNSATGSSTSSFCAELTSPPRANSTRTPAEAIRHVSHSAASRPGTPVSISVCKKELCM